MSDEKRKALIAEIFSTKPDYNPLPPEVLHFSSVFDWADPEKEDSSKSQNPNSSSGKRSSIFNIKVNFGGTLVGGLAGQPAPQSQCLSFYDLDHYYDSMYEYMEAKKNMLAKYIRMKREIVRDSALFN